VVVVPVAAVVAAAAVTEQHTNRPATQQSKGSPVQHLGHMNRHTT
jgi:hypothetical protein